MQWLVFHKTVDFMKVRIPFMMLSLIITVGSILLIWTHGMNYGIDFIGGLKLTYAVPRTAGTITDGDITALMAQHGQHASVQRFDAQDAPRFMIKLKQPPDSAAVTQTITTALTERYGEGVTLEAQEEVGPSVGKDLRTRGLKAVLYCFLAMLLYIGFRFDFLFAPWAVVALIHDVLVVMGACALMQLEFSLTMLAALLTIAGYSMNDTIIVYDRIREYAKQITPDTIYDVINRSITDTLSRAVITHVVTFISVAILYAIGGGEIKDFAFAFMVGIVVGTYSSLMIATPMYMWAYQWQAKRAYR